MTQVQDRGARLRSIFSRVLGLPADEDAASVSMDSHPVWDSMAHINLILAVEQEFRIQLTPDEASMAVSFAAFEDLIEARG